MAKKRSILPNMRQIIPILISCHTFKLDRSSEQDARTPKISPLLKLSFKSRTAYPWCSWRVLKYLSLGLTTTLLTLCLSLNLSPTAASIPPWRLINSVPTTHSTYLTADISPIDTPPVPSPLLSQSPNNAPQLVHSAKPAPSGHNSNPNSLTFPSATPRFMPKLTSPKPSTACARFPQTPRPNYPKSPNLSPPLSNKQRNSMTSKPNPMPWVIWEPFTKRPNSGIISKT